MVEFLWRVLAWVLSREPVADWLIRRSMRTPYSDILSADGSDTYMKRWWLFNPYAKDEATGDYASRHKWCPINVRVHHILRADLDRHLHDHPWNARTIILMGGYVETREGDQVFVRRPGSTTALRFAQFHRIASVEPIHGAVTLFITGPMRGDWGFKIPHREYLEMRR